MKKILIISYYFPPLGWSGVQRTLKYVKYLRNYGGEPIVVTVGKTTFSVVDTTMNKEIPNDVHVIRIDDIRLKDITDRYTKELLGYTNETLKVLKEDSIYEEYVNKIEENIKELRDLILLPDGNVIWANNVITSIGEKIDFSEIDVIYTTSSPYSSHMIGYRLKQKYNIPWIADFRDEWTNNPYSKFNEESLSFRLQYSMESEILKYANKITVVTELMAENYVKNFKLERKKVEVITNGYDEEDFKDLFIDNTNKFKIIHNGSFYSIRNPYIFLKAIVDLIDKSKLDENMIEIEFIGKNDDNIIAESLNILGDKSKILKIREYVSHRKSLEMMNKGTMLLLVIGPNSKTIYTGKVFEYLRITKPILSLGTKDSVVEELLNKTGCGINVEYDDIESIEKAILKFYNDWLNEVELSYNEEEIRKYERSKLTEKFSQVLDELI